MVNASKILTVSYGTFSCTLEGFDDPFSTMRSIAEYFRDLAAEDRYFGAEPPTPDPEMLHRIAEREIKRRVEARVDDNAVVLRQLSDDSDEAAALAPSVAPAAEATARASVAEPVAATPVQSEPESVAAKLARIRAAVARSRVETEPILNAVFAEDETDGIEPTAPVPETAFSPAAAEAKATETAQAPEPEAAPEMAEEPTEPEASEPEPETAEVSEPAQDEAEIEEEAAPEATAEAEMPEEASTPDQDAAQDAAEFEIDELLAVNAFQQETPSPEVTDEEDADNAAAAAEDLDLSSILTATEEPESQDVQAESDAEDTATEPETASPSVRVMKMSRDEFEAMFEPSDEQLEDEQAPDGDAEIQAEGPAVAGATPEGIRETLGETGLSPEDEEDLIRELVAVEQESLAGAAEPFVTEDEIPADADKSATDVPLVLSDTDITDDEEDDGAKALESLVGKVGEQSRDVARTGVDLKADDASVDRLLARTDSALEEGDGNRRRSTIAHLKAAVAAVRAEGGKPVDLEKETARAMNTFRDDLAHVVRDDIEEPVLKPRDASPAAPFGATPVRPVRPTAAGSARRRMPPLMLVSEQRVDKVEPEGSATPVRPRRIQTQEVDDGADNELFVDTLSGENNAGAGNIFGEDGDFKSFVAETGAEGVQELLEASLAYGIFVEGARFNSRPQIMRRVLSLFPDGSVTREDGLRAFGVLLREGRIHRVKRGEFLLPETSRFYQHDGQQAGPKANSA